MRKLPSRTRNTGLDLPLLVELGEPSRKHCKRIYKMNQKHFQLYSIAFFHTTKTVDLLFHGIDFDPVATNHKPNRHVDIRPAPHPSECYKIMLLPKYQRWLVIQYHTTVVI